MDHRKIRDVVFEVGRQKHCYHSESRWLRVITSKTFTANLLVQTTYSIIILDKII